MPFAKQNTYEKCLHAASEVFGMSFLVKVRVASTLMKNMDVSTRRNKQSNVSFCLLYEDHSKDRGQLKVFSGTPW